jgi:hypothetical protein
MSGAKPSGKQPTTLQRLHAGQHTRTTHADHTTIPAIVWQGKTSAPVPALVPAAHNVLLQGM